MGRGFWENLMGLRSAERSELGQNAYYNTRASAACYFTDTAMVIIIHDCFFGLALGVHLDLVCVCGYPDGLVVDHFSRTIMSRDGILA